MGNGRASRAKPAPSAGIWARVNHDLRQPIQSLLLLSHIMALTDEAAQRKRAARSMETSLQALQSMLDMLAQFARVEAGMETVTKTRVSLQDVAARVVKNLEPCLANHSLRIATRVRPIITTTDDRRATALVAGLTRNAVKLARGGEILLTIDRREDVAQVAVEFDGARLAAAQTDAVFIELREGAGDRAPLEPAQGLGLLASLASQIKATLEFRSVSEHRQCIALLIPDLGEPAKPNRMPKR